MKTCRMMKVCSVVVGVALAGSVCMADEALLGLWGDYSLNKNRIEIQSAEMEHDVCF